MFSTAEATAVLGTHDYQFERFPEACLSAAEEKVLAYLTCGDNQLSYDS